MCPHLQSKIYHPMHVRRSPVLELYHLELQAVTKDIRCIRQEEDHFVSMTMIQKYICYR